MLMQLIAAKGFGSLWFFLIILGIILLFTIYAAYAARQRTKALQELADSLGFSFMPAADLSAIPTLPQFQLFSQGRAQKVLNLMSGSTEATQVHIFDWRYTTGHGKHSHTHTTTVVAICSDELDLSSFYCRPANMLDWVGLSFDGKDINFEDRPLFSKKFHLHGASEKQVRRLFDHQVCEFFEAHLGMYAEGKRQWLVYFQNDRGIAVDKIRERFQEAFQLFLLLKARGSDPATDGPTHALADTQESNETYGAE